MNVQNTNQKSDTAFTDYLKAHRVHKEDRKKIKATHTGLPGEKVFPGTYYIDESEINDMHQLMYKHIFVDKNPLHLTETQNNITVCPYFDDVDLKQTIEENPLIEHPYNKNHIIDYCHQSMKILNELFDLTDQQKYIYVMEKATPTYTERNNLVKDGWHIMVPTLVLPFSYLREVREKKMKNKEINNVFNTMNIKMEIKDIIDGAIYKKGSWFMYGSTKPGSLPYELTYVFKYDVSNDKLIECDMVNDENIVNKPQELIDLFSLRNKSECYTKR